ncbi:hypothetical protein AURDEDRAFT_142864 [Auricularia subglabra TFB-10046 SS5]|nr:hypothetical protein AURDEDRAFT_142864 [Auricularia subglabra TFB-10046 SS5]
MSTTQSRVVFVGNVPYNMGEEQLIDVFKNVGQVVGFRLVFDRETGKPRGYGFCEFADHETAMSAVRNLNNVIVDGRPLRIDLADSDPFLEGKTTTRGELPEEARGWRGGGAGGGPGGPPGGAMDDFLASLPQGVNVPPGTSSLDVITQTLASMRPGQALEVLHQMKQFIIGSPEQARLLLVAHPQLAYALFQALLLHNIVDAAVLHRMLGAAQQQAPPPQPPAPTSYAPPPAQAVRPPPPGPYGQMPPPPAHLQPMPAPPPNFYSATPPQHAYPAPAPVPVPAPAPTPAAAPAMPDQQKVLMQVLQLTPDQIAILPEADRKAIMELRSKFMGTA